MAPITRASVKQNSIRLGARRGQQLHNEQKLPLAMILSMGGLVVVTCILVTTYSLAAETTGSHHHSPSFFRKRPIPALGNIANTVAMDIITSLDCDNWYSMEDKTKTRDVQRRRLEEGEEDKEQYEEPLMDDVIAAEQHHPTDDFNGIFGEQQGFGWPYDDRQVTGRDLMCLVAGSEKFQQGFDKMGKYPLECDAQGKRREALLDIWSSARGAQMPLDMIQKVLDLAVEKAVFLVGKKVHIWIPKKEGHLTFYSEELNKKNSSVRNIHALESSKGLFVDIGSGLGLSTLAVSILYPQATVVSIEPAMPSWLLQRISLVCNLEPEHTSPHPILTGVGAKPDGMLKMRWNPSASEKTRAWTPSSERTKDDILLTVGLRTLRSIMAEAAADANVDQADSNIVLNIDCEGCEYNVIPAMAEKEFTRITAIIGTTGVHWGYIPRDKLPSTGRGRKTHERLCSHYDFARQSIECCDFPTLGVKHEGNPTVSDLLGDLCTNFTKWAEEKNLYTSTDDWGWSELTSMADAE